MRIVQQIVLSCSDRPRRWRSLAILALVDSPCAAVSAACSLNCPALALVKLISQSVVCGLSCDVSASGSPFFISARGLLCFLILQPVPA
uniref:Uncharacterized protein n=1 Tax=Arundo donax TaxID=35708 RepID=A0A0A9A6T0_ARUDO